MTNNLKLITTETFGDLSCNFYRNMNDDILLTREQIGTALEYVNPSKAIQKIHFSHKDRLGNLCMRITENRVPQNGGVGVDVETIYYTQRGVMEICRFSRQPKANQFMDWVWDIIEKYRNYELTTTKQIDMFPITEAITSMSQAITTLTTNMVIMQQDVQDLKQSQRNGYLLEKDIPQPGIKELHLNTSYSWNILIVPEMNSTLLSIRNWKIHIIWILIRSMKITAMKIIY